MKQKKIQQACRGYLLNLFHDNNATIFWSWISNHVYLKLTEQGFAYLVSLLISSLIARALAVGR
jgi:molecular chaperone DnaK (HSP70)